MKLNEVANEFENIKTSPMEKLLLAQKKLVSINHQIEINTNYISKFQFEYFANYSSTASMHPDDVINGFVAFEVPNFYASTDTKREYAIYGPGLNPDQIKRLATVYKRLCSLSDLRRTTRKDISKFKSQVKQAKSKEVDMSQRNAGVRE